MSDEHRRGDEDEFVLPDYEDVDSDPHFKDRLRSLAGDRRLWIVVGVLLVASLVWIAGPAVYSRVKIWRAGQFMDRCEEAAAAGNLQDAIGHMRSAILMAPSDERIFRRVRLFNASIGDPSALNALQNMMVQNQASEEEMLVVAERSIDADQPAIARAALERLGEMDSARRRIVEMRLLDRGGNRKAAIDLARKALKELPSGEVDRILLAAAEMTLATDLTASQELLMPLAKKPSATGLSALRLLAHQQLARPGEGSTTPVAVATALLAHPMRSANDELIAADLEIVAEPGAKSAIVARLLEARADAGEEEALALARWLNRRQAYTEAIGFIGRERALGGSEWLLVYLDAQAGLDRWGDIFTMLDAETVVGLSDSIRALFLARAAEESGDSARAVDAWREMHRLLVYERPELVSFIAAYAARIGALEQAEKAYWNLARRDETSLEGFLGVIKCQPTSRPAADLIPIYEELLTKFPNLSEARSDHTYLQLLAGRNVFDAAMLAMEMHRGNPQSLATLSVAALGQLRLGDPPAALVLYDGKTILWSTAPQPWIAVRVAVLRANGSDDEAESLTALIRTERLRPEERDLLSIRDPGEATLSLAR